MFKKTLATAALALVLAAGASQAVTLPLAPPTTYNCSGGSTATGGETSTFEISQVNDNLWRGIESFTQGGRNDQRKIAFAKPVVSGPGSTSWEYTINPYGPQCKATDVLYGGVVIRFGTCTDGSTRTCVRRY